VSKSEKVSVPQVFVSNEKIQQERKRTVAMTKVFERLYLGDADDADRLAVLNPFGITGVVNVSSDPRWFEVDTSAFATSVYRCRYATCPPKP
jgi:hypothetical protein